MEKDVEERSNLGGAKNKKRFGFHQLLVVVVHLLLVVVMDLMHMENFLSGFQRLQETSRDHVKFNFEYSMNFAWHECIFLLYV